MDPSSIKMSKKPHTCWPKAAEHPSPPPYPPRSTLNEHPACREAAIRELEPENAAIDTQPNAIPAVIPHSARNSLFWLDPAEDDAQWARSTTTVSGSARGGPQHIATRSSGCNAVGLLPTGRRTWRYG